MALNNRRPCPNCPLPCSYHGKPLCVTNLINLGGENAPISLGLHLGLNHTYGGSPTPPCVRGNLGSAYWSTAQDCDFTDQRAIQCSNDDRLILG